MLSNQNLDIIEFVPVLNYALLMLRNQQSTIWSQMLSDKPHTFVFINNWFDETYQSLMQGAQPRGYSLSDE